MNDFNFFSIYDRASSTDSSKTLLALLVIIVAIAVPAFLYMNRLNEYNRLDTEIQSIDTYLSSANVKSKLVEYENKNARISLLENYKSLVVTASESLEKIGSLRTSQMEMISAVIPRPIVLESFEYANRDVRIVMVMDDRKYAAEALYNLKQVDVFEQSMLDIIKYDEATGLYGMTVAARLKEGITE